MPCNIAIVAAFTASTTSARVHISNPPITIVVIFLTRGTILSSNYRSRWIVFRLHGTVVAIQMEKMECRPPMWVLLPAPIISLSPSRNLLSASRLPLSTNFPTRVRSLCCAAMLPRTSTTTPKAVIAECRVIFSTMLPTVAPRRPLRQRCSI